MNDIADLAKDFLEACKAKQLLAATAESCTGGMSIASMTDVPGSSSVVDRGFVTYSNEAKIDMVAVSPETLRAFGAVSEEVARDMAAGALANSRADIALAVTGIAGPDGGSAEKPVGLVWFGVAVSGRAVITEKRLFENKGRDFIRRETTRHALSMGLDALRKVQAAAALP